MNRRAIAFLPTARQRYAACLERPVPQSILARRAFWLCAIAALVIWGCVISAAVAFWRWC